MAEKKRTSPAKTAPSPSTGQGDDSSPRRPSGASAYSAYAAPSETEIKAKQALKVMTDFGREVKRLGDLLAAKDSRIGDNLDKFKGDVDVLLNSYVENSETTIGELQGILDGLNMSQQDFRRILEDESTGFDKIYRALSKLDGTMTTYATVANTHIDQMGRLNTAMNQSLSEMKQLVSAAPETPMGRTTVGEKSLRSPAAAMHVNAEKTILARIEAVHQEHANVALPLERLVAETEAIKNILKQNPPISEAKLKANNDALISRLIQELRKITAPTGGGEGGINDKLASAEEEIATLRQEIEAQKKALADAKKQKPLRIDRSQEESMRKKLQEMQSTCEASEKEVQTLRQNEQKLEEELQTTKASLKASEKELKRTMAEKEEAVKSKKNGVESEPPKTKKKKEEEAAPERPTRKKRTLEPEEEESS